MGVLRTLSPGIRAGAPRLMTTGMSSTCEASMAQIASLQEFPRAQEARSVSTSSERIAYIDGLRAVAILTVIAEHAWPVLGNIGQSFGVELFFVISGFCLAYPTLMRVHNDGKATFDLPSFAARRIVRIVPPYYAAIAITLVFVHFGTPYATPPGRTTFTAVDVLRQALFLDSDTTLATRAFWSLAVEFRWYFIFPVALWIWARSPKAFLCVCAVVIVAAGATRAYSVDLLLLPAFMSGIVAAHLHITEHALTRFALPAFPILLLLAILRTGTDVSILWQATVFAFVIAAGSTPSLRRLLSARWIVCIGIVSYSIYLVHGPVINLLELHGVAPICAAIIAVAAGVAFWSIAERPFVRGKLRERLTSEFDAFLPRWFSSAGIDRLLQLGRP
jgi:peptidoglycan/LPS O-acetylase OafA/YrhL